VLAAFAVQITVLTMSPGSDVFARFGHTALLVEEERGARVYNFGAFKGDDPHIVSQFLGNAIPYYLGVNEVEVFEYKYRSRDVTGQRLALDDDQARRLAARLAFLAQPENRFYKYDWFRNNCTTRARDVIDEVLDGSWRAQLAGRPARVHSTIRSLLLDALWSVPTVATVCSLSLNALSDAPLDAWQELAMPHDLMRGLGEARLADGRPLVAEEWLWRGPAPRPWRQPTWLQPLFEALILYLLFAGAFARVRIAGAIGLMMWGGLSTLFALWFVFWSSLPYPDGFLTVNLIGWSPLAAILVGAGWRLLRRRSLPRWTGRVLMLVMAATVAELLWHVSGVPRQRHFRYSLYALVANGLCWLLVTRAVAADSNEERPWADKVVS
jgi:hypothetical protein